MKLTPYQKKYVAMLVEMRKRKMNLWSFLMFRPVRWLPFALVFVACVTFYLFLDEKFWLFLTGIICGGVARIFGHARLSAKAWPVVLGVTDWAKVDALQKSEEIKP